MIATKETPPPIIPEDQVVIRMTKNEAYHIRRQIGAMSTNLHFELAKKSLPPDDGQEAEHVMASLWQAIRDLGI